MSASEASSDLMASLSSSLHQILLHQPTAPSPSLWLEEAMTKVGVSSNVAALKLWSDFGKENDEKFCDARYLVWVCQHVLFATTHDADDELATPSLDVLQSWQQSMKALISNNGGNDINENDDEMEMGVMWQMLLHSLHLTPQQLQSAYHKALEYNPHIRNIDDISYCFMWPSFFKEVVEEASGNNGNKRQKSNHHGNNLFSSSLTQQQHQSNLANTAWWPLLGYSITHAILSSNDNNNDQTITIQQKMHQLQSSIMDSLPSLMGIPCFDYVKKHSLLSGVVACILDVLGEGLVVGSLSLDEEEGGVGVGGGVMTMMGGEAGALDHDILGVEVDQIVDLLLCSGALSSLAKRVNTPIANLVSEAAEMILNFSEVHHRLQQIKSNGGNIDDTVTPTNTTTTQLIQRDAAKVVQFISKANPQLAKEYSNRVFIPNHYFSTDVASDSELPPMHPIVVYIRALLMSGKITEVAKICRHLEECSGLSLQVKQHSWMLLLEKMHVGGSLIDDASSPLNDGGNGEVLKLGNIVVGSIGRSCVLEYLANVVLEARETLNPNQRGTAQAKQELRCLKDAVQKTCLRFLVSRAYSPRDALTISNKISDASNAPELEDNSKGHTAVEEATRILSTKLLYEEYNENLDNYEEEEVVATAADDDEEEEEVLDEDGPVDMSVDQIGTPFPSRKAATDDNETVSSPDRNAQSAYKSPESLQKVERWRQIQSSTKKHQHLRKSEPASTTFSPALTSLLKKVSEKEHEEGDEAAELHDAESSEKIAVDSSEEKDQNQKEADESAVDDEDDEQEASQEDAVDEGEYDSDATKSIESIGANHALGEEAVEEEEEGEEPGDITYPRHYHEYPGNYSESDDYEQEDEEEADRHVAFHEPAGDASEGDGSNVDGPEVVDLLDSTDSDEDQAAEAIVDEDVASSEEERGEGQVMNKSVDKYLAAHTCYECKEECPEMCATCKMGACESCGIWALCGVCEEVFCENCCEATDPCSQCDCVLCPKCSNPCAECGMGASDDENGANAAEDTDLNMADDEHDTEDDKYSLTEASQQGETFDEGEVNQQQGSLRINQSVDADEDHFMQQQQPSVLVAAAMSSQRQSAASNTPLQRKPSADNLSFDNTSAALASVDDNLSEYYDDKSQGENDEHESNVQVVARHHGHDMAIDSVLNAHADAIDSMDESSNADEKETETAQGLMTDDGYDAEVSEVEQANIDKMTRSKAADDDGYLPDAEVSEVEQTKTKKPKTRVEDEGYVPDGGHTTGGEEASEVEQGDDSNKKNKRDVRFEVEANLETTIAPSEPLAVEPATNLSIDDGYLPTDDGLTEEEKGPTKKSLALPAPSIDEGYIPDSGAITEEERLEKERKRRRYMDAEDAGYVPDGHTTAGEGEATDASQVGPDDVAKSPAKSLSSRDENSNEMKDPHKPQPSDERLKDMIDEGYLSSAVEGEGTEEERSEEEGANILASSRAESEPSRSSGKEEAFASVLVATATVLQQGGSEAGDIAQRASLPMKDAGGDAGDDAEMYSSEGAMSEERSAKVAPSEEIPPALESPSTPNPPTVPVEKAIELPEDNTAAILDILPDGEIEGDEEMEDVGNELKDEEIAVKLPPEETADASSEKLDEEAVELHGAKTSVSSEKVADSGHEEEEEKMDDAVELPKSPNADNPTNPSDSESEEEMEAEDDDSIGSLTVAKLREKCKKRGLKVSGRKADIIQRIKDHDAAAEKPIDESSAAESQSQKKRGRGRNKKHPVNEALEEHNKAEEVQRTAGPSSKSSSKRKSARAKKPSSEVAPKLDTPMSALTHHSESELSDDDDDETKSKASETESMTRRSRRIASGQKSIPKAIVTRGKKGLTLPAVPEGETLEDDEETSKPAAVSTRRSARARASTSVTSSSRRSTRAASESVASRVSRRSTKGKIKRFES